VNTAFIVPTYQWLERLREYDPDDAFDIVAWLRERAADYPLVPDTEERS
jgi:hypothetical protein